MSFIMVENGKHKLDVITQEEEKILNLLDLEKPRA